MVGDSKRGGGLGKEKKWERCMPSNKPLALPEKTNGRDEIKTLEGGEQYEGLRGSKEFKPSAL